MRIVFLAVDDEFAWLMQRYVYERHPDWVVGCVTSTSVLYRKNNLQAALFLAKRSGFIYIGQMIKMKILRQLMNGGETRSATALAARQGVDIYATGDINGPAALERLRAWQPDLLVSTNFSQYIGREARALPRIGAWNVHKSFLPHYRGMAPNFYALLEGAKSVGTTLHILEKGFDTGPVLDQREVAIRAGDTVYELNKRTADVGGRMLLDFLERLDPTELQGTPQPDGDWPTYSYPTRAQIRAFRRKGCRF